MKKFLFVCVENAGRSQMAEAFFRKYALSKFHVSSAGTNPSKKINPVVAQVMNEVGIDIKNNIPEYLTSEMLFDAIAVNMGCIDKESCPLLFINDGIEWNIPDPKGKPVEEVRKIRDQIESKVKELIANLGK